MQRRTRRYAARTAACVAFAAAAWLTSDGALACAVAPPQGQSVTLQQEDALIAWDEATHTEHFIRKAVFESTATDFGFLVPTPTPPALAEADEGLFDRVLELTKPELKREPHFFPVLFCAAPFLMFAPAKGAAPVAASAEAVRVLDVKHVAGLDATVLEADDAAALGQWLQAHGYPFRRALVEWVGPYIEKKWKITAFKLADTRIASNAPADSGAPLELMATPSPGRAHVVRMSFASDRPFYPYREPTDSLSGVARELHLYVLASSRMDGALESGTWAGRAEYAEPAAEHAGDLRALAAGLPGDLAPGWLVSFRDDAQARPPADLYFARGSQDAIRPPPIVSPYNLPVPVDLLFIAGIGVTWLVRRRLAKRSK